MTKPSKDTSQTQICHAKNCMKDGLYRARKSPQDPDVFVWFCLEHIRQHNASWNCFGGLSEAEIEKHIRRDTVWERPTWPFGKGPLARRKRTKGASTAQDIPHEIRQCLSILSLAPPVTLQAIKTRYRLLAKQLHPDTNRGSQVKIEKFHQLQQAFGTLQKYYARKKDR